MGVLDGNIEISLGSGTTLHSLERDSESIGAIGVVAEFGSSVDHVLANVTEEVTVGRIMNLDYARVGIVVRVRLGHRRRLVVVAGDR